MSDIQIDDNLKNAICNGQCILVLGPEFSQLENKDITVLESLRDYIFNTQLNDKNYLSEDGFFYQDKKPGENFDKSLIPKKIKEFYYQQELPDYYDKLAQLKFNLVISLSPDDLLHKALRKINWPHKFISFKKGTGLYQLEDAAQSAGKMPPRYVFDKPINDIETLPSEKEAMVFNFLGIYDDWQSLVFTYDDLFDFLYSVQEKGLPQNLRIALKSAESYLFLGFSYDKWYLKIIFYILEKILSNSALSKNAIFDKTDDKKHTDKLKFYKNQFSIDFTKDETLTFINKLYKVCDEDGCLRQKKELKPQPGDIFKILRFTANPKGLTRLDTEDEHTIIDEALQKSKRTSEFELVSISSTTQEKFLNESGPQNPDFMLFSMHGTAEDKLVFVDENKKRQDFSSEDFYRYIKKIQNTNSGKLRYLLFNCCNSVPNAREISGYLDYAIGMEGTIQDDTILVFTKGFFLHYFKNDDFESAWRNGRMAVSVDPRPAINEEENKIKLFRKKIEVPLESKEESIFFERSKSRSRESPVLEDKIQEKPKPR